MTVPRIGIPLRLVPSFDAKTWGGRRLAALGKQLPPGLIGESLESGPDALIDGGPFDGIRLRDLARSHADALLGPRGRAAAGAFADFPLLIKLIDANEDLSVQVHPDDATAPSGKRGKTEAWLILDAEPGARIVSGVRGPIEMDRLQEQLVERPVVAGEVYFVPAGTVHAIGAGVLLYEIQQSSDVTWRLYDWGRPREIHVSEALASAVVDQQTVQTSPLALADGHDILVACRYFALERLTLEGSFQLPSNPQAFRVLTVLDGSLAIGSLDLERGESCVLPADLADVQLRGSGTLLLGYIPDVGADVRRPLRSAGHDNEAIDRVIVGS